jgi:hypothetical protein
VVLRVLKQIEYMLHTYYTFCRCPSSRSQKSYCVLSMETEHISFSEFVLNGKTVYSSKKLGYTNGKLQRMTKSPEKKL